MPAAPWGYPGSSLASAWKSTKPYFHAKWYPEGMGDSWKASTVPKSCIVAMNRWPSRAGRKAPMNRTHSKRFAPAKSADDASAFGVRASSAPLSQGRLRFDARAWFMESPLSFFQMHWDHEPLDRTVTSWTAPALWRFRLARLHCQRASVLECGGKRSATPLWILRASRMMGKELSGLGRGPMQSAVAATLCRRTPKPGGTSDGSWRAPFRFFRMHWDHEPDLHKLLNDE